MENYYEILGVNEKATSSEIKRAYFKMIRKYSPEKDEKNFKRVREAYEVLSDPVTKGEYDNLMVISPLLRSNFLTAKEEMERGAFSNAIERLKEILRYQDVDLIRATLADAYLLNENSGNAIKLYEALVNKYPSQNIYKSKLGSAYVMRGWHKKALPIIKEALSHDEEDIGNWLALSEAYAAADELVEAIEVLEKGLKKDFDLSFKNILLFSKWQKQMMWWSLCDQDPDEEKKIANEIKAHVAKLKAETSPNDDLREMMAGMLMELCQKATLISCFEVAGVCINRIQTLVSLDSKMKEIVSQFEMQINMGSEIQNFFEDEIMDDMFIELIECYIIPYESLNMSRSEYDFNRMLGAAELAMHYKKYAAQLQKLKEKYPKLYAQGREFFERLEQPSERKKIVKQQKNKVRRQSDYIENLLYGLADFDDDDDDIFWSEAKQETVRKQKIGRNEPCPCGSGKKYKQCCGRN